MDTVNTLPDLRGITIKTDESGDWIVIERATGKVIEGGIPVELLRELGKSEHAN